MKEVALENIKVTVNAVCANGICLCADQVCAAAMRLLLTPVPAIRVVELRLALPAQQAEDIYWALSQGNVEILIQDIPSKI